MRELAAKLKYSLYIISHPLDGFYDLKHENRGSMKAAVIIYLLVGITAVLKRQFSEYLFNPGSVYKFNIFTELLLAVGPYLLWCVANWCFTSLMDGEGSLFDMVKATGYAMTPLVFANIIYIFASWFLVAEESTYILLVEGIGLYSTLLLVFLSMMITQQYTLGKTIATTVMTLIGMGLILFILLLLFYLIQQVYVFIIEMIVELQFRFNL